MSAGTISVHASGSDEQPSRKERRLLHNAKLRRRGENEPKPPQPGDITAVRHLYALRGHVVKYTGDEGGTWHYAVLSNYAQYFDNDVFGFATYEEVDSYRREHRRGSLLDQDFLRGTVVRPARPSEYRKLTFSRAVSPPSAVSEEVLMMLVATTHPKLSRKLKKALAKDPDSRTRRESSRVLRATRCL